MRCHRSHEEEATASRRRIRQPSACLEWQGGSALFGKQATSVQVLQQNQDEGISTQPEKRLNKYQADQDHAVREDSGSWSEGRSEGSHQAAPNYSRWRDM